MAKRTAEPEPDLFSLLDTPAVAVATPLTVDAVVPEIVVDGRIVLHGGVEYRALYLWSRAYEALIANREICQEFSPAHMGDVVVLLEDGLQGGGHGRYVLLAELVAVRDECRGDVKRFLWKFDRLRECHPRPGVRTWPVGRGGCLGRVIFEGTAQLTVTERNPS